MRVSGEDWVLANTNVSGYFRVNYDLNNWHRLLSLLNTNHQVSHRAFHLSNHAQMVFCLCCMSTIAEKCNMYFKHFKACQRAMSG